MDRYQFARKVFKQLFAAVGHHYSRRAVSVPEWNCRTTWTLKQQTLFRSWLSRELQQRSAISRSKAVHEAAMFVLFYGWQLKRPRKGKADTKTPT